MAFVSIIMPAYNPGHYIDLAVQSVLAQTFTEWELFIVDDGSTEDLSRFKGLHSSIHLIRQENRGLSIARNVGIENSIGEYIACLDADDVWRPEKLERQIALMEQTPAAAMCHTHIGFIDETGQRTRDGFTADVTDYYELLKQCTICISTALIRRRCLTASGLFDPLYASVQDYDMWLKLSRYYRIVFLDVEQVGYRVHSSSMSSNLGKMYAENCDLLRRHLAWNVKRRDHKGVAAAHEGLRRSRIGYACGEFDRCRASLRSKNFPVFCRHLKQAFQLSPIYVAQSLIRHRFHKAKQ